MYSILDTHPNPIDRLKQAFAILPNNIHQFFVAFSGGLDSHVLLHATQQLFPQQSITAVHINHGLQSEANNFEQHCQLVCNELAIPLKILSVNQAISQYQQSKNSPEEAARKARYKALKRLLGERDCLLTGHHLDDQAETLLLQLMRGTGLTGIGSMRLLNQYAHAYHLRPLLSWSRKECLDYATTHALNWIEDATNQDQRFRRNFIRHTVIPAMKQQYPHVVHTLGRAAMHSQEASDLCHEIAIKDLSSSEVTTSVLSIKALLARSVARRRNALRYWLKHHMGKYPSATHLASIDRLLYPGAKDGITFCFKSAIIKRYRNRLYYLRREELVVKQHTCISWNIDTPLTLSNGWKLAASVQKGNGIQLGLLKKNVVEVRFRQGGERFQPSGHIGSSPLKKLFQQWAVPPWKRYQWPLIYYNNQLIAIPDYAVSSQNAVSSEAVGLWISTTGSSQ